MTDATLANLDVALDMLEDFQHLLSVLGLAEGDVASLAVVHDGRVAFVDEKGDDVVCDLPRA